MRERRVAPQQPPKPPTDASQEPENFKELGAVQEWLTNLLEWHAAGLFVRSGTGPKLGEGLLWAGPCDSGHNQPMVTSSPVSLPPEAVPYAAALQAILCHPATFREWAGDDRPERNDVWTVLELPVTCLLLSLLRRAPKFADAFFPGVPDGQWWEGDRTTVDIVGGPERYSSRSHLLEVKFNARVSWNKANTTNQFDNAIASSEPEAIAHVLVPFARSGDAGAKYREYLESNGVESWERWKVVTWQEVRDWLTRELGGPPNLATPDATTQVALSMACVWV